MLKSTFLHVRRVGPKRERALWHRGVASWEKAHLVSESGLGKWSHCIPEAAEQSLLRLDARDARFFASRLPAYERWRLYREFENEAVFLDIETTWRGEITLVGISFKGEYRAFIRGRDLDRAVPFLRQAGVVVTYFGAGFDLPVIARELLGGVSLRHEREGGDVFNPPTGIHLPWAGHIDLCPILHKVGIRGGLKASERQLGLARPEEVRGLSSEDAPRLWEEYLAGGKEALGLLVAYNREDVVNLRAILERILLDLESGAPRL